MKIAYASAAVAAFVVATSAVAADVDFSGQTIELIVPYGPGGGSTAHAQALAPLLAKELPGQPTIIIQNVEGGGTIRGLNLFHERAAPDGLTIAALGASSYYHPLLGVPTVEYPLEDFRVFLASPYGLVAYGRADYGFTGDPVHDVELLRERGAVHVGDGPNNSDLPVMYCYDLLDISLTGVWGTSRGDSRQAFMRGESQVNYDNMALWEESLEPMMEEGTMVPLFTLGYLAPDDTIQREPTLPDTPTCMELYEMVNGEELGGVRREIYDILFSIRMAVAKALVLPAGTPDDIFETYQKAMARVVARPEMAEPSMELILGGYPQIVGDAAVRAHRQAATISPEAREHLINWLRDVWGVQM